MSRRIDWSRPIMLVLERYKQPMTAAQISVALRPQYPDWPTSQSCAGTLRRLHEEGLVVYVNRPFHMRSEDVLNFLMS